ncbi:sulfotransferase [Gemmatimonadota bacterium]
MYTRLSKDLSLIPEERIIHVQYEQFIKNPMETAGAIYVHLDLDGFEACRDDLQQYVDSQRSYQSNVHVITDDIINLVNVWWGDMRDDWGYERMTVSV